MDTMTMDTMMMDTMMMDTMMMDTMTMDTMMMGTMMMDTMMMDTMMMDTMTMDTMMMDTMTMDTMMMDTMMMDTMMMDTMTMDTMMMDTMTMDTMMMDTMMMDTMMMDTMMMDTMTMDTMTMDTMMMDTMMMDTMMMDTMTMDTMTMDTMMMDTMTMDTMMMDTMTMDTTGVVIINCPMDTSISCLPVGPVLTSMSTTTDSSGMEAALAAQDPSFTGMATAPSADTIYHFDERTNTCPVDTITRTWIAQNESSADTCQQIIIVTNQDFNDLIIADTVSFSGLCPDELDIVLMNRVFDLPCGIVVSDVQVSNDTFLNDIQLLSRAWTLQDTCRDTSLIVTQTIQVIDPLEFGLANIAVTPDTGGLSGMILFDLMCAQDSLMFLWSDGSTDTTRMNIPAGEYELVVTDVTGGMDTFNFTVNPPSQFSLSCPPDTIVSCDSSLDPSLLGEAQFVGFDSVRFVDIVIDSCPGDLLIDRQWIASSMELIDTCIQQISVQRNGISLINIPDSTTLNGICIDDLLDQSSFDLACGIVIDTIILDIDSVTCGFANLNRTITFTDECIDSTMVVTQNININDLPVARLVSQNITADNGEGNGMIDLTFASCSDSISFQWSNGATTEDLPRVIQGDYTLVISNELGCMDTLEFVVPSQDPTAFLLQVRDRDNEFIDVNTITIQRATGADITTNIIRLDVGRYQVAATNQTVIRGDQVCMDINEPASIDLSVLDVIRAQRHILGLESACAEDLVAGDVNFSGGLSVGDLALMQRIILGLSEDYPDSLSWTFMTEGFTPVSARQQGCVEIEDDFFEDRVIDVQAIKLGDFRCDR